MRVVALPLLLVGHSSDCAVGLIRDSVSLPLFGFRSGTRSRVVAYWASWADALHMIFKRGRSAAEEVVRSLHDPRADCVNLWAAASAAHHLDWVRGFEVPEWEALLHDARPPRRDPDVFERQRSGWQHEATRVEQLHREGNILPALVEHEKALLHAKGRSGGGRVVSVPPCFLTRIDRTSSRCLLLRRFHLSEVASSHLQESRCPCQNECFVRDIDLGAPVHDSQVGGRREGRQYDVELKSCLFGQFRE